MFFPSLLHRLPVRLRGMYVLPFLDPLLKLNDPSDTPGSVYLSPSKSTNAPSQQNDVIATICSQRSFTAFQTAAAFPCKSFVV